LIKSKTGRFDVAAGFDLRSLTPLNLFLKAFILGLNESTAAFLLLFSK